MLFGVLAPAPEGWDKEINTTKAQLLSSCTAPPSSYWLPSPSSTSGIDSKHSVSYESPGGIVVVGKEVGLVLVPRPRPRRVGIKM